MPLVVALIAHEGGWDEVLLVGGPIVLIIGLLAVAKRRVDRIQHLGARDDRVELDQTGHEQAGNDQVEHRRPD